MALPAAEWRAWAELSILIFLSVKAAMQLLQRHEDDQRAHGARLDEHGRRLGVLDDRVQSLREIRIAERLSKCESTHENFRAEFVSQKLCDERTSVASKERNHDHPHAGPR